MPNEPPEATIETLLRWRVPTTEVELISMYGIKDVGTCTTNKISLSKRMTQWGQRNPAQENGA